MDKQVGVASWRGSLVGLAVGVAASWPGSLEKCDGFQSESTNDGSLASDDSFLKSSSTTGATPGNVETIDARDPELTDTATMHDLDPMTASLNDPLDGELYKRSDEDQNESWDDSLDDSDSDSDTCELSPGFRERVSELLVVLLNRKRKRDELDGRADDELLLLLTKRTRERKENRGLAESIVDRPAVLDDDGAVVAGPGTRADPIVLSDSESEEGDCGIDVARNGDAAADESIAPTTVPVGNSDGPECFGWLEY